MDSLPSLYQQMDMKKTFSGRKNLLETMGLKKLGEGSGRTAYQFNEDIVIKVAKNPKGQAQNEVESNLFPISPVLNKVFHTGEEDTWLSCCYAQRVSRSLFKKETGMNFESFSHTLKQYGAELKDQEWIDGKLEREEALKVESHPFFLQVVDLLATTELATGDLARITSYGSVEDRVVVIDYGLTSEVYREFYKKKKLVISSGW